jgi:hypothetical protein
MIGATTITPGKATQPMRVVTEETHADTIPPPEVKQELKAKGKELKEKDTVQMPPLDKKEEPGDGTPKAEADKDDSVPTEIAHADTGRTQVPSVDKDKSEKPEKPESEKDKST